MKSIFCIVATTAALLANGFAQTVWIDDFESYSTGVPPTNHNDWISTGGAGSSALVVTNLSYDWRSSAQLTPSSKSVRLYSTASAHAAISRMCSNAAPALQRISWSCLTSNANVDAMYLQVRDSANHLFCGVGMGANGNYAYKTTNGGWADTQYPYALNVWHRLTLTLNYADKTFSLYEKGDPIVTNQPLATYQTTNFIPANIYVQGPVVNPGISYVDAIKAEFLQDGSGLQSMINSNAAAGRCDLPSGGTYDVHSALVLPSHFILNGNGSTLRMAPYTQLSLLVNSNWSGDSHITVSNVVLDGNAYDQAINPANNSVSRYSANDPSKLDNQGGYFKAVNSLLISGVTFQDIPNEALMAISSESVTVIDCVFTNCALLMISNNMSQGALYTRWTSNSFYLNNRLYDCFEGGVTLGTGSDHNFVAGNYSTNSAGGEGVFIGQSSYCTVVGNTILNSSYLGDPLNYPPTNSKYWGSGAGIACDGINQPNTQVSNTICYNYMWRIGSAGITSASAIGTHIYGNEIYLANCLDKASPAGAIAVYASTNVSVHDNIVQSNNCAAIGISASKGCSITNNLIAPGNDLNAVDVSGSATITTNYNFSESASSSGAGSAILVDNTNSTGVTITGSWVTSSTTAGYCGNNYLHDNNTGGSGGKSVRFSPSLAVGGTYAVFLNWTAAANRASNAPVDVIGKGSTNTLRLDQRANGGKWNWLGNVNFAAGNSGSVIIRNDDASGYVIADAVEFALLMPLPATPGSVTANGGNNQVVLSWDLVPTARSYNVKRSNNSGGPFIAIGTTYLSSFTDFAAANGTTYYYKISAANSGGESADSAAVSASPSCGAVVPSGLAPTVGATNNQVSLSWDAPTGAAASQVASFNVKRSTVSGGPYTTVTNTTSFGYLDPNATKGVLYYYVVSAINPCGAEGADSAEIAARTGLVVDNADSSGVTTAGSWTASANSGDYGANYLHDGNAGGGKSVRFTPNLPVAGTYDVYLWWVASSNRATNAPVDVIHSGSTNTVYVNQTVNGSRWNYLGKFEFSAGTAGSVRVRDDGANGYVVADAAQWVWNTNSPQGTTQFPALLLTLASTGNDLNLSWPVGAADCVLETATNLAAPVHWETYLTIGNGQTGVTVPASNTIMFYRLRSP